MKKTIVIYGHPYYQMSACNKTILDEFHKEAPEAEIINLMELYPNFEIDVEREQKRLQEAEVIVFQFPFWWYGSPSIMHRYVEDVFAHGFAYGSTGTALHGKKLILSFTAGGPHSAYTKEGYQHYYMSDFMPPFIAMANLCGLELQPEIVSYGMMIVDPNDTEHNAVVLKQAKQHGKKLADAVKAQ